MVSQLSVLSAYQAQHSFMVSQLSVSPYQAQRSFMVSQLSEPSPYQAQLSFTESHVPEDAHPLRPKTIIKAINRSSFILAFLLTAISGALGIRFGLG